MSVQQMQRVYIYALKNDRKKILELIQRQGFIEVENKIYDDNIFYKEDMSLRRAGFEKNATLAKEAISILEKYSNQKSSMLSVLNGRKEVSTTVYYDFSSKHDNVLQGANHIIDISKKILEKQTEVSKFETQREMLLTWKNLDIPVDFDGTKHTSFFIGTLPNVWSIELINEQLSQIIPVHNAQLPVHSVQFPEHNAQLPMHVEVISTSKEQTCILAMTIKENEESLLEALRTIGFSFPDSTLSKVPTEKINEINELIKKTKKDIEEIEIELVNSKDKIEELKFLQDYETMRADKYDAIGHLLQTNNMFIFSGFIPSNKTQVFLDNISSKFDAYVEFEEPGEDEEVPTLLKNNSFSSPLESTVESFGTPDRGEIDPTMIMSLFYYMLFGLMLSDAAYGAIIAIMCAVGLIKYKNTIEEPMRKTLRMYLYCGLATIFWGVMFGSYFGDLVDIITMNFFGNKITIPPLWFFPVEEPMRMLVFSMLIGIIHLLTGLSLKLVNNIRSRDFKAIIYDVFFWYVLLISSVIYLLSMKLFVDTLGLSFILPPIAGNISAVLVAMSAIGIIATNGRESKNPFKRFLKGLYALYGITGYLSDVLSYSRLLALGLATGVICTVINKMAAMTIGVPFVGPIIFFIIIIFGHILNIGINALGAYVHTTRLQYVEFFGKFYGGSGRKFQPLSIKTKYFKFKEEK